MAASPNPTQRLLPVLKQLGKSLVTLLVVAVTAAVMAQVADWSVFVFAAVTATVGLYYFVSTSMEVIEAFVMLPDVAASTKGRKRVGLVLLAGAVSLGAPALSLILPLSLAHGVYAYVSGAPSQSWYFSLEQATYGFFGLPSQFDAPGAEPLALVQAVLALLYTAVVVAAFASVAANTLYQFSGTARAGAAVTPPLPAAQVQVKTSRWPWGKPVVSVISIPQDPESSGA